MSGVAGPNARKEPVLNAESLKTVTRDLEADGVAKFAASYAAVLAGIDVKAGALAAR